MEQIKAKWQEQFSAFEESLNGHKQDGIHSLREEAFAKFCENGFPTQKSEDWKYTNVSQIARGEFKAVPPKQTVVASGEGVVVLSFTEVLRDRGENAKLLHEHLGKNAETAEKGFTALNTAFLRDGVFVHIGKGVVVDKPLEFTFNSTNSGSFTSPRVIIIAEANSKASIIERFIGPDGEEYFTNAVTELVIGENATIGHYKFICEGQNAFHIGHVSANVSKGATLTTGAFPFGGALVRNEISPVLIGEESHVNMYGLSVLKDAEHVDNFTVIDHAVPHCTSEELYKGIYADKSRGVFSGTIIVREEAQKTNAIQNNNSILLSDTATVNAKPQLKIWADDVRCTHGATIGQIDEEAVFYLCSRGIPKAKAREMLIRAFALDVIERIDSEEVRTELESLLDKRFSQISHDLS